MLLFADVTVRFENGGELEIALLEDGTNDGAEGFLCWLDCDDDCVTTTTEFEDTVTTDVTHVVVYIAGEYCPLDADEAATADGDGFTADDCALSMECCDELGGPQNCDASLGCCTPLGGPQDWATSLGCCDALGALQAWLCSDQAPEDGPPADQPP